MNDLDKKENAMTDRNIIALAAIRTALLTAPPGWKLVPVEVER